jgi:hypothetical protein
MSSILLGYELSKRSYEKIKEAVDSVKERAAARPEATVVAARVVGAALVVGTSIALTMPAGSVTNSFESTKTDENSSFPMALAVMATALNFAVLPPTSLLLAVASAFAAKAGLSAEDILHPREAVRKSAVIIKDGMDRLAEHVTDVGYALGGNLG